MNTIGNGSLYDTDMELVESFVRCDSNRNSTASVFEYYTSRLRSYWEKCKENIDILTRTDLSSVTYYNLNTKKEPSLIMKNMKDYEKKFFKMLDQLIETFYKTYEINVRNILSLIIFITDINCLILNSDVKTESKLKSYSIVINNFKSDGDFFFIFNDSGYFYLNSYLYALFNGVIIIGIPSSYETEFDGNLACPTEFLRHDIIGHSSAMIKGFKSGYSKDERFLEIKEKYFKCINDNNYSTIEKENVSFAVWMCFHEFFDYYLLLDQNAFFTHILETDIDTLEFYEFTKPIYEQLYNEDIFEYIDKNRIMNSDIVVKSFIFSLMNGYLLFKR